MRQQQNDIFHELRPGQGIEGDWCSFPVPLNIKTGPGTVFDSSSIFKKFFSKLPVGLSTGQYVTLQGPALSTEPGGYIEIGDYSFISSACIVAADRIIIGSYVFIAGGVTIVDSDFHPMDAATRLRDTIAISTIGDKSRRPRFATAPVVIEDEVWIGFNATILKGVTIGKGSVIQPGAVVSKNIAAGSVVSGNPAIVSTMNYA